jgi:regulator of ribonuclease activity A
LNTTDLSDKYPDLVQIPEPIFGDFGGVETFSGPIATVKTFEDNTLVRATLETPGAGRVLVVDGGASMRCALLGDNLAQLAIDNGWTGIVVYGCIRDSEPIGGMDVGVKALATHPRKSVKNDYGWTDVPVTFAGVTFTPGHYLYADPDGIVVAPHALTL